MCVLFSSNSIYALRIEYLIFSSVVFLFFSHFELKIILSSVVGVCRRRGWCHATTNSNEVNRKRFHAQWKIKFQFLKIPKRTGNSYQRHWCVFVVDDLFFFFDPEKREKTNRSIHAIWTTLITNRISLFREIYKRRARTLPPVPRAFMNREMKKTKHVQWAMTIRSLCVLFGDREESLKFE